MYVRVLSNPGSFRYAGVPLRLGIGTGVHRILPGQTWVPTGTSEQGEPASHVVRASSVGAEWHDALGVSHMATVAKGHATMLALACWHRVGSAVTACRRAVSALRRRGVVGLGVFSSRAREPASLGWVNVWRGVDGTSGRV